MEQTSSCSCHIKFLKDFDWFFARIRTAGSYLRVNCITKSVTANAAPSLSKDVCMKSCFIEDDSDAKT